MLTVAYPNATVAPASVNLTGTGVSAKSSVSISALTITTLPGNLTAGGTVILTNTSAAGGSSVAVSNVAVTGSGGIPLLTGWAFTKVAGADHCTGANLAPGATCAVDVRFTRGLTATGTHTGTITFTDTGLSSPQAGPITGIIQ